MPATIATTHDVANVTRPDATIAVIGGHIASGTWVVCLAVAFCSLITYPWLVMWTIVDTAPLAHRLTVLGVVAAVAVAVWLVAVAPWVVEANRRRADRH